MKIVDFLKEENITLNLKASDKKEAIEKVASCLKGAGGISDFDVFFKAVFEREKLKTTGIGKEAAIPHARTDAVKEFVIALGRFDNGVDFASIDGKPVKLVFLMGTPREKWLSNYLKILAHLIRLLQKESFRKILLQADSPAKVIKAFSDAEE
ncbi:MAG: hypothetical protein DRP85_02490 [Candidatus Makaraimicrobium thalassicum]|nr:MAG: hypothetical protein DRP85_02490 [Candidatus Omnitrophota bacterium]